MFAELVTDDTFEVVSLLPFLSCCTDEEVHFARISRRLLAAVLFSAQVGVSWKVGKRIICWKGVDGEGWDLGVLEDMIGCMYATTQYCMT